MIRFFEKLINPTAAPENPEPPAKLIPFYWHYARQAKGLFILLFVIELFVALLDTAVPWFIGKVVTLVSTIPPDRFLADTWPWLIAMAVVMLVARPGIVFARYLVTNQALAGPFSNLIRWQSHWHVVRQSWPFFQNDFAGRIANRVMQTGHALRESAGLEHPRGLVHRGLRHHRARCMMAVADWRLAMPIAAVVRRLRRASSAISCRACATVAKTQLGSALAGDGPRRRQLHQHPHRQAVRARRATRTRTSREAIDDHTRRDAAGTCG